MMSTWSKGSQGLCRSGVALLFLKSSSAAFLSPDVKGREIAVSSSHLCHFAVKGLEMAAIISYPDKMEI